MSEVKRERGVTWDSVARKWKVRIGQKYHGVYAEVEEANKVAKQLRKDLGMREYGAKKKDFSIPASELRKTIETQAKMIVWQADRIAYLESKLKELESAEY